MSKKVKKISDKTKLAAFEAYFERMHFHRYVTGNQFEIGRMIAAADELINVKAAVGTSDQKQEVYNAAFAKFKQVVEG